MDSPESLAEKYPLRVGRSVGRTVYIQFDDDPSKSDLLIGVMDTPDLAKMIVHCVNVINGFADV